MTNVLLSLRRPLPVSVSAAGNYELVDRIPGRIGDDDSGIPGGIFAPSLAVGAGFGSTVGSLLGTSIALAAILGMAGYSRASCRRR
ncbi:hypothetical protein ACVIDN_006510 [Rhizobium brockwellii]